MRQVHTIAFVGQHITGLLILRSETNIFSLYVNTTEASKLRKTIAESVSFLNL